MADRLYRSYAINDKLTFFVNIEFPSLQRLYLAKYVESKHDHIGYETSSLRWRSHIASKRSEVCCQLGLKKHLQRRVNRSAVYRMNIDMFLIKQHLRMKIWFQFYNFICFKLIYVKLLCMIELLSSNNNSRKICIICIFLNN